MGIHYHGDRSWTDRPRRALRVVGASAALAALALLSVGTTVGSAAATCTSTGFVRDSIDLTAAQINPTGTFGGTLDATGCNIGIYYSAGHTGTVSHAEVFGANYYGIVNDGGNVKVLRSVVHDIGENPFNGTQHGVAVAYIDGAKGQIEHNTVYRYQKGGIEVVGMGEAVPILDNTVVGLGPVDFIAQNGIEVGDGAKSNVNGNTVTGNSYTGPNDASSGGILVFGGACFSSALVKGIKVQSNHLTGNDVGVWIADYDVGCNPPTTATKILVASNVARNDAINNTTGWGDGTPYQAGIADTGNGDTIKKNRICGAGYKTNPSPPPHIYEIDVTFTSHVHLSGNKNSCSG